MTLADIARANAISFEVKKDALQQRQSGDWKISFTVQGVDMDERITRAAMGTRFIAVLVEINDDETPVQQPTKEVTPNSVHSHTGSKHGLDNAAPQPSTQPRQAGAKRDWRDLQPAQQAGIRCAEPTFRAFLREEYTYEPETDDDAAEAVRDLCGVNSRADLNTIQAARVIWHQLDTKYQAWKALEHA